MYLGISNSLNLSDYPFIKKVYYYKKDEKSLSCIVNLCNKFDLLVINGLDSFNLKIVNEIIKEIKIAWRFFGFELYEKFPTKIYSPNTLDYVDLSHLKLSLSSYLKQEFFKLAPRYRPFNRSIKRIDYFLGYMKEEYNLLASWGIMLPKFVPLPIISESPKTVVLKKEPYIIIGNSRNLTNNHLDIIHLINNSKISTKIYFKLLFSYGVENSFTKRYITKTRNLALENDKIEIIENFLLKEDFENLYKNAAALVLNSYRQMALGNILIALTTGTKIYLSEKNSVYWWLKNNYFNVYSIEKNFSIDLESENIYLSYEKNEENLKKLEELKNKYSMKDFHNNLKIS